MTFLYGANSDFSKWQEQIFSAVDSKMKCEFIGFMQVSPTSRNAINKRISSPWIDERRIVYRLVQTGRSVKQTPMELGRHPSTLYREMTRNRHLDEEPLFHGYSPTVAQTKTMSRRVRGRKLRAIPNWPPTS